MGGILWEIRYRPEGIMCSSWERGWIRCAVQKKLTESTNYATLNMQPVRIFASNPLKWKVIKYLNNATGPDVVKQFYWESGGVGKNGNGARYSNKPIHGAIHTPTVYICASLWRWWWWWPKDRIKTPSVSHVYLEAPKRKHFEQKNKTK